MNWKKLCLIVGLLIDQCKPTQVKRTEKKRHEHTEYNSNSWWSVQYSLKGSCHRLLAKTWFLFLCFPSLFKSLKSKGQVSLRSGNDYGNDIVICIVMLNKDHRGTICTPLNCHTVHFFAMWDQIISTEVSPQSLLIESFSKCALRITGGPLASPSLWKDVNIIWFFFLSREIQ